MPRDIIEISPIERRFDDLMRGFGFPTLAWPFRPVAAGDGRPFAPPSELTLDEQAMVVRTDLPGIDATKDVTVLVEDGDLVIRGERKQKTETKEKGYHRSEVFSGYFERRFALPKGYDEAKIAATYVDGVLEVKVPLAATTPKPKTIKIEAGKPAK